MSVEIQVRPATRADLDAIAEIQAAALSGSHWRAPDYLMYACSVAVRETRIAGFLASREVADECEILNLAVSPEFRRLGVATALVRQVLSSHKGCCFLEVRESNKAARSLYRKLGFEEIAMRSGYYDNPPESAIVMRFFS